MRAWPTEHLERGTRDGPEAFAPWRAQGWLDEALSWIGRHVRVTGPVRRGTRHAKPWSIVLRVPTSTGDVWFKQVTDATPWEPPLVEWLAAHAPEFVPAIVTADRTRMLTRDSGSRLIRAIREGKAPSWEVVARRYAELQITVAPLSGVRVPDSRPETIAHRFGRLVDPLVDALGDAISPSLAHIDVSHVNVCVRDGKPVFVDWAAAAVAHPFCGLTKTLRVLVTHFGAEPGGPDVLRVRDAYLEPWTAFAPAPELRRVFAAAYPLGLLCRALDKERLLAQLRPALRARYAHQTGKWLDAFAEAVREPGRLGV